MTRVDQARTFFFFLTIAATTFGCTDAEDDSGKQERAASTAITYGAALCESPALSCAIRTPALVNAEVDVMVLIPEAGDLPTLRVNEQQIDTVKAGLSVRLCVSGSKPDLLVVSREGNTCPGGAKPFLPFLGLAATLKPKVAGKLTLDVVLNNEVIAAGAFEASLATDLLIGVEGGGKPQPDGSYSVRVNESISVRAIPKDGAAQTLQRVRGGITFTWDDTSVVEPAADDEGTGTAKKPGVARMTITAGSVSKTVTVNTFDF